MSFSEITRKIANSLIGVFSNEKQHKKAMFQPRRLHIDPLEERQLLSVNVVMPQEKMLTSFSEHSSPTISSNRFFINANNSYGGADYTETVWGSNYMASNNQGDTVIVWAQNDFVYQMDINGNYVEDRDGNRVRLTDRFGNFYDDYNIYARYLTDQVERLTIPEELLTDNIAGADGSFKLVYAPYTVQKLSIKSVSSADNLIVAGASPNIVMNFSLGGEDVTGNGVADFTASIPFDENLSPAVNARRIQRELRNLGGIYADITVTAESATDFLITFGEAARMKYGTDAVPELQVRDSNAIQGNYPGILISTVSVPLVLSTTDSWGNDQGIRVDPNNPQLTAERLQQAFNSQSAYSFFPRVQNYTRDYNPGVDSAFRPSYQTFYTAEVSVTYVNATTFDITFINGAGLSVQSIMLVSATDEWGTEYVDSVAGGASASFTETMKKSSDVFRVNAPEENDPTSSVPLVTNQLNPSVAMDADGDFVITWQSEVSTTGNNTISDIYARRFSPQAMVEDSKISFFDDGYTAVRYVGGVSNNPIQGVRPVGDQFKVNAFSNSYLSQPSVGMDFDGNFIIAWSASNQIRNDGNTLFAKRYDRYGTPLSDAVQLTDPNVYYPLVHSNVAISNDGYAVITWIQDDDRNASNTFWNDGMYMSIFAPGSMTPMIGYDGLSIGNYYNPNVSFDANNNFLLTYSNNHPAILNGVNSSDVLARLYAFDPDAGTFTLQRSDILAHYLNDGVGAQFNGIGGLDADGDIVLVYQGYGPDSNRDAYPTSVYELGYLYDTNIDIPGSYFAPYLNEYKNGDLQRFFNPAVENFYGFTGASDGRHVLTDINGTSTYTGWTGTADIDLAIRWYLARAQRDGATPDQIARLNAVFEAVVGQMRGGANDIFSTNINKGDWTHQTNTLGTSADANLTSTRDGINSRFYVAIPMYSGYPTNNGQINFRLQREVYDGYISAQTTLSVDIPATNNVFNPRNFLVNLSNAFNGSSLGTTVEVRYYDSRDYEYLYGDTMWDLPSLYYSMTSGYNDVAYYYVYEIVFVGTSHDTRLDVWVEGSNNNALRRYQAPNNPNFFGDILVFTQHSGYQGTPQTTPGLSVLPNGSYIVSWFTDVTTSNGTIVDTKINYRYFHESTDNVGPTVTDVILPNGQYMANQQMVTYSLEHIVVTFDEELLANGVNGTHSVLNPSNWSIIKDGVKLTNAIKSISFGMNAAKDLISENPNSIVADSFLAYGSNKWEVIIEFNEPLGTGNYELVASNMICDTSGVSYTGGRITYNNGNALGSDGTNVNGRAFSRNFSIVAMDGTLSFYGGSSGTSEKLVSTGNGDHYTRTEEPVDTPKNPTAVASDQNGNFVTVWTAEDTGGILAMIYRQEFIDTGNGRESIITPIREIQITSNPNASYASVAMDADGDFVVTWMQDDLDGRNIYAKAYNFNGSPRLDANGNPTSEFRVNSHTGKHNYPAIAMGLDGSFVITWESLNQVSKNSGYDIYFQRYDSSCTPIGGVDAIQGVVFKGDPSPGGTFQLRYVDEEAGIVKTTQNITIGITLQDTARNIKAALAAVDLEVEVGVSSGSVLVQFVGAYGAKTIAPLIVVNPRLQDQKTGQSISVSVMTTGASGETRANDTTLGDKRYPAIAMAAGGEFTITWTSWGQGNDSPYQTNIYAKNFPSNDAVASRNNQVTLAERIEMMNAEYNHRKLLMAADSPDNHVTPSDEYSGIVYIMGQFADGGIYVGSGTLLTTGMHILTAAHVVAEDTGTPLPIENIVVRFETAAGFEYYGVSQNYVHPSYTGNYTSEVDLAILTLERVAPAVAQRYDIYRGNDELDSVVNLVGYGTSGTGWTGNVLPPGTRRSGYNKFEALGTIFDPTYNPNTLAFDFDSGYSQNDAFGYYFGIRDLGLGAAYESGVAGGDSGGPSLLDGRIAGVHSYGGPMYANSPTDATPILDASFGEFAVDVRVSAYADWIDSILVTGEAGTFEYLVNQTETGNQMWSDVAISMSGEVVFTWTSFNQDGAGDGPGGSANDISAVYARRFNLDGTPVPGALGGTVETDPDTGEVTYVGGTIPLGDEFRVNDYIVGNQWQSSVSIANNGDFMITWESFQDKSQVTVKLPDTGHGVGGTTTETVTDYGVYAKRFTNLDTLLRSQDNPGGAQYGLPDTMRFIPGYGYVGIHGEIGTEFRINNAQLLGDQTGSTVALNANGDAIIVFQSQEQSGSKVYYRAVLLSNDLSAPIVTETVLVVNELIFDNGELVTVDGNPDSAPKTNDGVLMPVRDDSIIYGYPTHMVITFSEEMFNAYVYSTGSILNPANWLLYRNGVAMFGAIVDIQFRLDAAYNHGDLSLNSRSGQYEAVITFSEPLLSGDYLLTIRDAVTNVVGNNLDGNYDGAAGGNFTRAFEVVVPAAIGEDPDNPDPVLEPEQPVFRADYGNDKPAIASADDGSYVIVAVHYGEPDTPNEPDLIFDIDPATGLPRTGNIVMQRYDKYGAKLGTERIVNNYMGGNQTDPEVAMDGNGNIAVVWSGNSMNSKNGIYLRIYNSNGEALCDQVWVNGNAATVCSTPNVAYDNHGNIVVTWMEYNATTRSQVIMSRVYDSNGIQQNVAFNGAASSKASMTLVAENTRAVNAYDIAFAPDGELIITWQIHNAATNSQDIYAKVLKYAGTSTGAGTLTNKVSDFLVNQYTNLIQARPSVAACATGFVITWASERQAALVDRPDLKSDTYDIFARRFNLNGVAQPILGTTGDCLINTQKVYSERMNTRDYPEVSMAPCGNFVITWTSYDQEPNNYDVAQGLLLHDLSTFARAFGSNGADLKNGDPSGKGGTVNFMPNTSEKEFRLNFTTIGNQKYSVAAISDYGMSFAWIGDVQMLFWEIDSSGEVVDIIQIPSVDVFSRAYSAKAKTGVFPGTGLNSSLHSSYSLVQPSGGGGYIGQGVNTYKYENQEVLFLDGTDGNDVFEIIVTASGTFQAKLNGKSVTVGSQVRDIQIDGLGGQDTLIITNAAGDNSAKLNAENNLVSFSTKNGALTVSALRTASIELNVGGKNNSLQVVASAHDVLSVGVNDLSLIGENHTYIAKGFDLVSAMATASSASAILYDSAGDDVLTMMPQKAVMKGQEFEHTVSGFGNISAYSTRGNNVAYLNGSTGDDALFASGGTVALAGSGYKNTIFGFEKAYVIGNGGNDSATLVGSYAADRFTGTDTFMEAVFGRSNAVNIYGFRNFTVYGNGGNDVVTLNNIMQGTGLNANNSSATKTYLNTLAAVSYTIVGINDVRGLPQQTPAVAQAAPAASNFLASDILLASDIPAVGETPKASPVALSEAIYEDDIYQLLALEHEQNSKKTIEDQDDELDIDYLLKIGAL